MKRALDKAQYGIVAKLADEIWHEHYSSILSPEQIDYMVGKFQSAEEIERSCADGAEYYIACADGAPVGYIGLEFPEKECFLSKLYLKKEFRGLGIGKKMFELAEKLAEEHGEPSLMLDSRLRQTRFRKTLRPGDRYRRRIRYGRLRHGKETGVT